MKKIVLVAEVQNKIRIIGIDYDSFKTLDTTLDLENIDNPGQMVKQVMDQLRSQGFDTTVLEHYFNRRFGNRKGEEGGHGKL